MKQEGHLPALSFFQWICFHVLRIILLTGLFYLPACSAGQDNGKELTAEMNSVNPYYSRTDTSILHVPDETWRKILPESVYQVARKKGTERAFTGRYWDFEGLGTYHCAVCGNALFVSDSKFSSSCGWPSFFEPIRNQSVIYQPDSSHGMIRTEVLCGRCSSHLGHLFDDGPPPTGKRFCMNSIVLDFVSNEVTR